MGQQDISEKMLLDYNDVFADVVNFVCFGGIVAEVLVHRRLRDEWKPSTQEMAHFYSITRLLTEVTHDNYYGDMVKYVRPSENVRRLHMCELFDRARAEGRSEGLEQGIAQGIEQGMQQGRAEGELKGILKGKLETARKMLSKHFSIEDIIDLTGLSLEQVQALAAQAV